MSTYEQPEWGIKLSKYIPIPQRYILAFMSLLSIMNAYTMRNCLPVTLTQLVKERNYSKAAVDSNAVCPREEADAPNKDIKHGDYDWDQQLQGVILGSFYIGYVISHVPGGVLADIFGGKWVLSLGIFSTSIFTLITPVCLKYGGHISLIVLRALMGLGEGTTFPALSALLSRWVPISERGKLGSLVMSGAILGQILAQTLAGVILDHYEWPVVFYFFGIGGALWFIFFTFMCYSEPYSHPFIRQSEKDYILAEMGTLRRQNTRHIPWKEIGTSKPVYALVFCQIGYDWGFYIMATDLPKYMNDVLQFNVLHNGIYSSVPFMFMWFAGISSGIIGDLLIKHNCLSVTKVRKLMTSIAAWGPSISMLLAAYAGCRKLLVVALFCVGMFLMGPYYGGIKLTPLDMSPNYAGILMSIANGSGSLCGFFAPFAVGLLTPNTTIDEWRSVFWMDLVILSVAVTIYITWSSGEVQEWNEPKKENPN